MRAVGGSGLTLLGLLGGAAALAQVPTFPATVESVRVSVLVTRSDRPLRNLAAADFEVRDNGVPQEVEIVSSDEVPLSLILVFDVSGSVQGPPLESLKGAAMGLVKGLERPDRAALLTFATTLRLEAPLTTDRAALRTGISALRGDGDTSLVDGTFAAMAIGDVVPGRVVALVFTDGKESASRLPETDALAAARRTDVVVYGVQSGDESPGFLGRVTEATGGRLLHVRAHGGLRQAFLDILTELRARYLLRYTPRGVERSGWHALDVRVRGRRANVLARKGYRRTP